MSFSSAINSLWFGSPSGGFGPPTGEGKAGGGVGLEGSPPKGGLAGPLVGADPPRVGVPPNGGFGGGLTLGPDAVTPPEAGVGLVDGLGGIDPPGLESSFLPISNTFFLTPFQTLLFYSNWLS